MLLPKIVSSERPSGASTSGRCSRVKVLGVLARTGHVTWGCLCRLSWSRGVLQRERNSRGRLSCGNHDVDPEVVADIMVAAAFRLGARAVPALVQTAHPREPWYTGLCSGGICEWTSKGWPRRASWRQRPQLSHRLRPTALRRPLRTPSLCSTYVQLGAQNAHRRTRIVETLAK